MSKMSGRNRRETGKEIDSIGEDIQTIAELHKHAERKVTPQVEALKKTVDPHRSLETLDQLLNEEEQE